MYNMQFGSGINKTYLTVSVGLIGLGISIILYGINLRNRSTCVVCGANPPCFVGVPCKPNSIEGRLIYMLRGY